MYCGNDLIRFYKTTSDASDDRLKESGELIEHACETLSKLRHMTRKQIWKMMILQLGIKKVA